MALRSRRWALALVLVTFALLLAISRAYGGATPPPHAPLDVEWRVPVGCGFSGFFTEVALGFVPALLDGDRFADDGLRVVLLCGQCSEGFLRTALEPRAAAAIRRAWADEATRAASLTARSVVIEHGDPCGMRRWSTKSRPRWVISRTMSEGDPTAEAVRCLRGADEVWVPTAWHVEAYAAAGVERRRLLAVPEPVDVDFFAPDADAKPGAPFVFFSNFKWEARKGWDVLLEAYWSAFTKSDGVRLLLKTYLPSWEAGPPDLNLHVEAFARQLGKRRGDLAAVELHVDESTSRGALAEMYRGADAFVLPTRGEGWGLPIAEAMASGLPVIATNFSGPTAFLTDDNSYPLRVARRLPGGQAEPSVADVAQAMRRVRENTKEARRKGERARADMAAKFSSHVVAAAARARLEQIRRELEAGGASPPGQTASAAGERDELRRRRLASSRFLVPGRNSKKFSGRLVS